MTKREWVIWLLILVWINGPLLFGSTTNQWNLVPHLCLTEPWRWLTHPFAHVSVYHLLIDASAFLSLLHAVQGKPVFRLGLVIICAIGGAFGALLDPVNINLSGFGGLSGAAHGLAIYAGWIYTKNDLPRDRLFGWCMIALVMGKSIWEATSGTVFLHQLHFGSIGKPITWCHLGGALAGLTFCLCSIRAPRFALTWFKRSLFLRRRFF